MHEVSITTTLACPIFHEQETRHELHCPSRLPTVLLTDIMRSLRNDRLFNTSHPLQAYSLYQIQMYTKLHNPMFQIELSEPLSDGRSDLI